MDELFILIAQRFVELYDRAFINPFAEAEALTNILTEDAVFSFPQEQQLFPDTGVTDFTGDQEILDSLVNTLTRLFPNESEILEILPSEGNRIAIKLIQSGVGTQTGRDFAQTANFIVQINEEALNALDEDTINALLAGEDVEASIIDRVEFYSNSYPVNAAVLDIEAPQVPSEDDPLTFQAPEVDLNADTSDAIDVAVAMWEALAVGDLFTVDSLNADDTIWSFSIGGPEFLPVVGTSQGFTADGETLSDDFSNAGPILAEILGPLGQVVDPGTLTILETFAEGNRVLVHLQETGDADGDGVVEPAARETDTPYQSPLDLFSWITVEDGVIVSNEVVTNNYATVNALRPGELSPLGESVGETRHAPPFFVTGSRINEQILTYDENGNFQGVLLEVNGADAPELLQPIGLTYSPDGELYVNATLGAQDAAPLSNAVLRFEGVYGIYPDGTTPEDRTSREDAADNIANNLPGRLQNVDPERDDYNPALIGDAHGEFFDENGQLLDPGSLVVVPFATGLDSTTAVPYDPDTQTLVIIDPDTGTEENVFADAETGNRSYIVPLGTDVPVAIADENNNPVAVLGDPDAGIYIDPGTGETVFNFAQDDAGNGIFTDPDTGETVLVFDIFDPRVVFNQTTGAPDGLAVPGLLIPSGVKFGDDGNLYVASAFTSRILQYDGETGEFLSVFATRENGVPVANLLDPNALPTPDFTVFVFGPDGGLYAASLRTDIDPTTGRPELNEDGVEDLTVLDPSDGAGAVLRFPGPSWEIDPATGNYIDPITGDLVAPGQPAGLAVNGTDLTEFGVYGETGGLLDEGIQPLDEPSAVAFGPDLNLYVASAQTGEVLVYAGPFTENPGEFLGVFADVGAAVRAETGRGEDEPLVLSGMGFGPDGNLYVGSSFEDPETGAPVAGSQFTVFVGPNPEAFDQEGTPGESLGAFGDVTTDGSRLLLPTTPEFTFYENSYKVENEPTRRFPEIAFVVGVNTDLPLSDQGIPGFFQSDNADAVAAYDDEGNFLGYLGTEITNGELAKDIDLATNPIDGIGGVILAPTGNILVSSQLSNEILEFNSLTGAFIGVFGDASAEGVGLDFPAGMVLADSNTTLYVSDLNNGRILRFDGYDGEFLDDPDTEENEGVLVDLVEELGLADGDPIPRLTDLAFGPDGRVYVAFTPALEAPELGAGEVRVYNPETEELEIQITGFDFPAAIDFGPDGNLYVADDPASLVNPATGEILAGDRSSSVSVYEIDNVHPLLIDPLTGNGSPDGERSDPVLLNEFETGFGDAGAITVVEDVDSGDTLIYLSEPLEGVVNVYTPEGELLETITPPLPPVNDPANGGVDENGQGRPTGSTFIVEQEEGYLLAGDPIGPTDGDLTRTEDNTFILSADRNLKFTLSSVDAGFINELGIYQVEDGQTTEDILADGKVIFSALSDTSLSFLDSRGFSESMRILEDYAAGEEIGFYVVANSTTDAVEREQTPLESVITDAIANLQITDQEDGTFLLSFEDGGGSDFDDLQVIIEATTEDAPLGNNLQGDVELIDLRDLPGELVVANINATGRGNENNEGGLYRILDEEGTVFDPVTGNFLSPTDEGYDTVALTQSVVNFTIINPDPQLLSGGFLYAPYLVTGDDGEQFHSPFGGAIGGSNGYLPDHLRLIGDNNFAFEDSLGLLNRDYNDFVFELDLATV